MSVEITVMVGVAGERPNVWMDGGPKVEVIRKTRDGKTACYVDMPEGRLWWTGDRFTANEQQAMWR